MKEVFRKNNFDLIRLIAALQVVVHHTISHLEIEHSSSVALVFSGLFPGVPIFFFVSGFLISKSYENNSSIKEYTQNRILRIYPALIVCTFIALLSVYVTGYFYNRDINIYHLVLWVTGQISFFQFYNPEFMRYFGTGVLNGSLWTITVELQFYIMIPVLYFIFGLAKRSYSNLKLIILIIFFMTIFIIKYKVGDIYSENIIFKLLGVSFIPWIWMFLIGVFFQKNFIFFHKYLSGKILYVLPIYLLVSYICLKYFEWNMGNGINPIIFILLAITVFSFSYSFPNLSKMMLKRNDISYGVYIYHIPLVNILMYYGLMHNIKYFYLVLSATIILAVLSWFFIEKNSMKFKKHPLNPLKIG